MTPEEEKARQENEKAAAERQDAEAKRAAENADAQKSNATEDEEVADAPYRAYDPVLDIDTNCYMGTAHGAPVGPMTQGCGLLGRVPFGNKDNLRPLGVGDPDAVFTAPTVEVDKTVPVFAAGDAGYSEYQKAALARHQEVADRVTGGDDKTQGKQQAQAKKQQGKK